MLEYIPQATADTISDYLWKHTYSSVHSLCFINDGTIACLCECKIVIISPNGFIQRTMTYESLCLSEPSEIVYHTLLKSLLVCDRGINTLIQVSTTSWKHSKISWDGIENPEHLSICDDGNILVASNNRLTMFNSSGKQLYTHEGLKKDGVFIKFSFITDITVHGDSIFVINQSFSCLVLQLDLKCVYIRTLSFTENIRNMFVNGNTMFVTKPWNLGLLMYDLKHISNESGRVLLSDYKAGGYILSVILQDSR